MGVDHEVIVFYGVTFEYDELKYIKDQEFVNLAKLIGCNLPNDLPNIWSEFCYPLIVPYYNARPDDILYGIGKQFQEHNLSLHRSYGYSIDLSDIKNWLQDDEKKEIDKRVFDFCERNNLLHRQSKLIIMPSVL